MIIPIPVWPSLRKTGRFSAFQSLANPFYIESLAAGVCRQYKISAGELCSGSRRQSVVKARAALSWIGVRELGYSGAEVARYLGVTNSCVTRIVASASKPPVDELI